MAKKGSVTRIPNGKVLEEYGISRASASALTRKIVGPMEINNEIELHPAVLKMEKSMYVTGQSSSKKHDKRLEKTLERLNNLGPSADSKLAELHNSKEKYQSDFKMDHEIQLEQQRLENRRKRRISLSSVDEQDESQKARSLYDVEIKNVSVNTNKKNTTKKTKAIDSGIQMSDEIKKLRVSVVGADKKDDKALKNAQYLSPSSQFFAAQLGWIEHEVPKRIDVTSPLQEYKTEENATDAENVNENQVTTDQSVEITGDEFDNLEFREMDYAEIQRLERKYKKEAEDIRKQMEKQNRNQDRTIDSISTVYDKLLGDSPAVKVAKTRTKDLSDVSINSKDVDISKIPSFVLEEQKRKETSKK